MGLASELLVHKPKPLHFEARLRAVAAQKKYCNVVAIYKLAESVGP
jgi:hypothetical protein